MTKEIKKNVIAGLIMTAIGVGGLFSYDAYKEYRQKERILNFLKAGAHYKKARDKIAEEAIRSIDP